MIWLLLDSSSIGGIEKHVAILAQALARAGHRAEILLLADNGDNPWFKQLAAAQLPYRVLGGARGLAKALFAERPALLHTHGYKANIIGRVLARAASVPVVSTFHAGERAPFPVSAYQYLDEYSSLLGRRLCVSKAIRDRLPYAATLCDNFMLSPATVPTRPLPRQIAFVGRLSHEKGPDLFCELAARRRDAGTWHVYGDGPMRAELEARYSGVVTFHGLVADLSGVWPRIGLLVMPSRAEGLPMAALEALSEGVPIVASAVGALPELIVDGETGWLFATEQLGAAERGVDQWAQLSSDAQRAMRQACWSMQRERYSDVRHLPTILAEYRAAGFKSAEVTAPAEQYSNRPAAPAHTSQ